MVNMDGSRSKSRSMSMVLDPRRGLLAGLPDGASSISIRFRNTVSQIKRLRGRCSKLLSLELATYSISNAAQ